ncbi:transcriptional regulator [Planobispora siamensis]|uniref:Transcriptional regulator n=1 Tax=Planobispora siamensis TaxID=936338 RepID=A0A8J3SJR8_9ACTN|nr:transcriptional regulator [Planobispora siamensis]
MPPERRVGRIFVELADTLTEDFDIMDYLDNLACHGAEVPGVSACVVLLADPVGPLSIVAASSESARMVGVSQLRHQEGPSLQAYQTGAPVCCTDLQAALPRWPHYAPVALAAGFASVHAFPLCWQGQAVGGFSLLRAVAGRLDVPAVEQAQDLAQAATIGLLHRRTVRHHESLTRQLQVALNSRVLIEQAKGMLAGHLRLTPDQAFALMRDYARAHHLKLTALSRSLLQGEITVPAASRE